MIYSITEGQQLEDYKKNKEKETKANKKTSDDREQRRSLNREKYSTEDDKKIRDKANEIFKKENDRRIGQFHQNMDKFVKVMSSKDNPEYSKIKKQAGDSMDDVARLNANEFDAKNGIIKHIRRHPDKYNESYGIFEEVWFINEASFASKRKIIKSEDYAKLKELQKKYKEDKNPDTRVQLMEEAIKVTDKLIEAARSIPADNPLEWIGRLIIRQFDDPIRVLWNIMGMTVFRLTPYMTRDDFVQKLVITREKLVDKYEKNRRKIERHS